jgi:hypothetical protein
MPSIQNLVADLDNGSIVGMAGRPSSDLTTGSAPLSGTCLVNYNYVNMKASLTPGNRLQCEPASSIDINGTYLHYRDYTSTITRIDVLRPIVVSGNFSGCAYKVYNHGGILYCAHIARPNGVGADANLNLMDNYARQKGWQQIQHIPTAGYIGVNGCREVVVVSQLRGRSIDTVLVSVSNVGLAVGTVRTTTAF